MNRFLLIIILFTILLNINISLAWEWWYKLYEERVKNICKTYKSEKPVFKTEEYKDYSKEDTITGLKEDGTKETYTSWSAPWNNNDFENATYIYKKNMNNIYKCWIILIQQKSLNLIKNDLVKSDPDIKKKIENALKKVELTQKKLNCKNNNTEKDSLQKLKILKETTYELCKYSFYLEYIKERNKSIVNSIPSGKDTYSVKEINTLITKKENELSKETERVYKIFPIAFKAYTQYENNYTIHILLELLKDDFITFRENLHNSINPINQVVYKISNAMNK